MNMNRLPFSLSLSFSLSSSSSLLSGAGSRKGLNASLLRRSCISTIIQKNRKFHSASRFLLTSSFDSSLNYMKRCSSSFVSDQKDSKKLEKTIDARKSNNPLLRYLIDELGYDYDKDIRCTALLSPTFLDLTVDTFKQYREVMISSGLPENILVHYGYAFMRDDFKSFPDQVEMLRYVKDRLQISDDKEINLLLFNNPKFLSLSRDEIGRKMDVFQEEIPTADIEDAKKALVNRKRMWLKTENDLRNILRLLKEEYGMRSDELRDWFTEGNSHTLFSEKMLVDGAERKLIFEDVYGKGCFEERKSLRTTILHNPHLLSSPVSHYYSLVNRLMGIFSYDTPSDLNWMNVSILTYNDLDRIEKRIDLVYKYFTNGKELKKGEEREYKVEKSRYEEKQKELEMKYPMDGLVKEQKDHDDDTKGNEADGDSSATIKVPVAKSRKVPSNSIDEERLYEDYVKSVRSPRGEKMDGDGGNSYDEMVSKLLREYEEKGKLDILEGVGGHGEWKMRLEEKLGRLGLRMEDLYRELWRESEGLELSHEEAMKYIKGPTSLGKQIHHPMQRLGMLTVYLGLSNTEASKVKLNLCQLSTYSLENNVAPRMQLIVPVVERYLHLHSKLIRDDPKKVVVDGDSIVDNVSEQQRILRECVQMYRNHPVRRELRSFVFQSIFTFVQRPYDRWKEAIEQWEVSESKNDISRLYQFANRRTSRK